MRHPRLGLPLLTQVREQTIARRANQAEHQQPEPPTTSFAMDIGGLSWHEGHIHLLELFWMAVAGLRWSDCQVHLLGLFATWFA